jgi:phosphoglycolate phosphatase
MPLVAPFDAVLFDLDGTLTDPEVGITGSYRYALEAIGRPADPEADLRWVIGPPLRENFTLLGVPSSQMPAAEAAYRRRHLDVGLYEADLVPGMAELVRSLDAAGVLVALATAKPELEGALTLAHFGLESSFAVIGGNTDDGSLTKADVVAGALRLLGNPDPGRVAMVGDRRHDIEGAAANGVTSVGVAWGFAADGELLAAGADHVVSSVAELGRLLSLPGTSSDPTSRTRGTSRMSPTTGTDQVQGNGRTTAVGTTQEGGTRMSQQENEDAAADGGVSEDAKAKFREALDRKKAGQHKTADGQSNTGHVHGSETSGPVQRTFRRRAGSA